jgi:hypothetical protein
VAKNKNNVVFVNRLNFAQYFEKMGLKKYQDGVKFEIFPHKPDKTENLTSEMSVFAVL